MSLEGKRALVTGASRGIGAAIAQKLAAAGADVAITYEKSAERAAQVVRNIEAHDRRAVAIQADSADVNAIQRSVKQAVAELGGLDILINNVGIIRVGDLKDIPIEDIEQLIKVNIRAPIVASKAVLPHLRQGGSIVTLGSYLAERVPGLLSASTRRLSLQWLDSPRVWRASSDLKALRSTSYSLAPSLRI